MHFVPKKKMVVADILAASACALLFANVLPASTLGPKVGLAVGGPSISPFALMMKAPRDRPVERFDAA